MIILNVCSFALTASAMFGFIHESIRQLMLRRYGEEFWTSVLARSGFEAGKENIVNHYYPDSDTYALVDSVSALSKMPREEVWCMYGAFLIEYTMEIGWDELLRTLSPNLKGFLDNLDSLHHFIDESIYKVSLRGPSFRTEQNEDDSITLHYFTGRPGLYPIVKGVLREVAKRVFKTDIVVTVTGRTQRSVQMSTGERIEEHVTLLIREVIVKTDGGNTLSTISNVEQKMICENAVFRVSHNDFLSAFPYHFIIDRDCKIVQAGKSLFKHIPTEFLEPGTPLIRIFEITRPRIPLDFDNICNFINAVFVLQVKSTPSNIQRNIHQRGSDADGHAADSVSNQLLKLKGQMLLLSSKNHVIYLCSPYVTSIPELLMYGMRLNAMPLHDATRDLILLNQQRLSDVEVNFQLEANNEQLEQMAKDLEFEKGKTDALLKEMLPASVASQLINGETVDAKEYDEATVMFCDIPSFASNIILCGPKVIVFLLNELFTKFDALVVKNEVYKVETVTDSYLTVGGIPDRDENHCERICHLALGMIYTSRTVMDPSNNKPLQVRCGVNTGYCLFGDTVNTASRMESHSPASRIHCSQSTFESANTTGRFEFQSRGKISIKGKGEMETYFLKKSFKKSIWEIIGQSRDENLHSIDGYQELHDGEQEEHLIGVSQITSKIHSKSCSLQ